MPTWQQIYRDKIKAKKAQQAREALKASILANLRRKP